MLGPADSPDRSGLADLASLTPQDIHGFITDQGRRYARKTMQNICWLVRGFLTHLYRRGVVPRDLGPVVVSHDSSATNNAHGLTRPEVEAVLVSIDRQEPRGGGLRHDAAPGHLWPPWH